MKIKEAMDFLKGQMKLDPEYAWGWLCNIAMPAYDEGLAKPKANLAAARFMKLAFDVDMTKHEHFSDTQEET